MNPADVVTVPRAELHRIASQIRECADEGDGGGLQKLADELETHGDAAPASEPGEAVAWRFTDEEGKPLTDYWEVGPCGDYARGKAAKYGWTVEYAYAAPPSLAALTNPKDSDAEASLRALLAALRELTRYELTEAGGLTESDEGGELIRADELAAILSTWTESTQAQNAGSSARYPEAK